MDITAGSDGDGMQSLIARSTMYIHIYIYQYNIYLETTEQLEGDDGEKEADDRYCTANVGDYVKKFSMDSVLRFRRVIPVHEDGEVGEVIALADRVRTVALAFDASFLRPIAVIASSEL